MIKGIDIMESQLKALDFLTKRYDDKYLSFEYRIPHGRFRDQIVEIALDVPPEYPLIAPSGPYIKPFLLPINGVAGAHPFAGIHQRNLPTAEFQYWSRPFLDWESSSKNVKEYISFLRTLFDFL